MFDRNKKNPADATPAPVSTYQPTITPVPETKPAPQQTPASVPAATRRRDAAVIGASIQIEGHRSVVRIDTDLSWFGPKNQLMVLFERLMSVGVSLMSMTVTVKIFSKVRPEKSVVRTRIEYDGLASKLKLVPPEGTVSRLNPPELPVAEPPVEPKT